MRQQDVLGVIQRMLDYLADSLSDDQNIELRDFGTFRLMQRKARIGRNPRRPDHDVPIPSGTMVNFRPGKKLQTEVMKLTQTFSDDALMASLKPPT